MHHKEAFSLYFGAITDAANVWLLHKVVGAKPAKYQLRTEGMFMASIQFVVKYFSEMMMKRACCASSGAN